MTKRYPEAEILLYLSTRAPDAWLKSAHWEHVKASNMTMDADAFCDRYHAAANLEGMVADIASRVPCPVHHTALEDCRDLPLGPADPLLDLCELPLSLRAELVAPPPANMRLGDDVLDAMIRGQQKPQDTRCPQCCQGRNPWLRRVNENTPLPWPPIGPRHVAAP